MEATKNYRYNLKDLAVDLYEKQEKLIFLAENKSAPYDGEHGTTVQPIWNHYDHIRFDGSAQVRSAKDVAFLMRALESKSIEHAFAVHVNKEKEPFVQFVGMGGKASVIINADTVLAGAKLFDAEKVYLVHNHPTGSLMPSKADLDLTQLIEKGFHEIGIDMEHLIINTYKEYFTIINPEYEYSVQDSFERDKDIKEPVIPIKAYLFDGVKTLCEPIAKVKGSSEAIELIQQFRFSALPKFGVLPMDNSGRVLGNFLLEDLKLDTLVNTIVNIPLTTRAVAYGNKALGGKNEVNQIKEGLENLNIAFLDYIQVNSDSLDVEQAYTSYANEGLLDEIQEKYKTQGLNKDEIEITVEKMEKEERKTDLLKR